MNDLVTYDADDLNRYLNAIRNIPQLSADEEYELAMKVKLQNDLEAAYKLIESNLRFVVFLARSYKTQCSLADLIQEGNIGLMQAVKKFDPEKGVRLITFASFHIKHALNEYILKFSNVVKCINTKPERKVYFHLKDYTKTKEWFTGEEIKRIANDLNVSKEDVERVEYRLHHGGNLSYHNASNDIDTGPVKDKSEQFNISNVLHNEKDLVEYQIEEADFEQKKYDLMESAFEKLNERQRDIITKRYLVDKPVGLVELSKLYGISSQRVQQVEQQALKILKNQVANIL